VTVDVPLSAATFTGAASFRRIAATAGAAPHDSISLASKLEMLDATIGRTQAVAGRQQRSWLLALAAATTSKVGSA